MTDVTTEAEVATVAQVTTEATEAGSAFQGPALRIAIAPALRGRLADQARGRTLVIGFYAASRCGVNVGDMTVSWRDDPPSQGHVPLASLEGVPVHADARLVPLLGRSGPELSPGGTLRRGRPSIKLSRPECWIEFLEHPSSRGSR